MRNFFSLSLAHIDIEALIQNNTIFRSIETYTDWISYFLFCAVRSVGNECFSGEIFYNFVLISGCRNELLQLFNMFKNIQQTFEFDIPFWRPNKIPNQPNWYILHGFISMCSFVSFFCVSHDIHPCIDVCIINSWPVVIWRQCKKSYSSVSYMYTHTYRRNMDKQFWGFDSTSD